MVLEPRGVLVLVMIAVLDERVVLFEVVGRFFADSVGMMREGADSFVLRVGAAGVHEFHEVSRSHPIKLIM